MHYLIIYLLYSLTWILTYSPQEKGSIYPIAGNPECLECHADLMSGEYIHPVAETECTLCHESTGKDHPQAGVAGFSLTGDYPGICYQCHDDKNSLENVHTPVQDGYCSTCHSPHSSSNRSLIHSDFSENSCLDCHVLEMEDRTSNHGPALAGECINCHDPHQSDYPGMMKEGINDLCLSCHDRSQESGAGQTANIKAALTETNIIHDPIVNGDCIICHIPHASDYPMLLIGQYPTQQYTEATVDNFEICFMCHDSDIIMAETTEYATNFRNGTQNLHYLHIKGTRGRNCNLCHNAHGAPNKHIIESTVQYGQWAMPLKAVFTENGGSCATGCHKKLEYSRIIE